MINKLAATRPDASDQFMTEATSMTMATFTLSNLELFTTTFSIPKYVPDLHDFLKHGAFIKSISGNARAVMMSNISTNCREIEKFPREICFPEESPQIKPHSEGHSQCSRRPSVPTALSQKLGHWSFPPHSVVLAFQAFE